MMELLKPFLPWIAGAVILVLIFLNGYSVGIGHEKLNCVTKVVTVEKNNQEYHDDIEKKVMGLTDDDLDKRLSRWMRDKP